MSLLSVLTGGWVLVWSVLLWIMLVFTPILPSEFHEWFNRNSRYFTWLTILTCIIAFTFVMSLPDSLFAPYR